MAASSATTVEEYLAELPDERAEVVREIRELVLANVPDGVVESMNFGMIAYEIPLERYPMTYNKQPLMYASIAAQKNHYSLYLYSVYASDDSEQNFRAAYEAAGVKLDMGKACVRFKRLDQLVPDAIAVAINSVTIDGYIELYEASRG